MTAPSDLRVLIVTPLDYLKQRNNVEHNRAEQYARRGCRVTVIYKTMNQSSRFPDLVRDTLTCRFHTDTEGAVRLVGVDPFFNYFAGLRKDAEERPAPATDSATPASAAPDSPTPDSATPDSATQGAPRQSTPSPGLRLRLVRLLSPLAVLRDVFALPGYVLAALKLRERPDVVLGVGPWGALVGWILRGLSRTPLVVYVDHDFEPGLMPDRLRRSYIAALERTGVRRADLVVSVGRLLAERRRAETGRADVHVIPNGVDWEAFAPARRARSGGAARSRGRTLVYVGNVISWSGLEPALEALAQLDESLADTALVIVGDGLPGYVERLRGRVRELGLEGRVRFLGQRPPEELAEHLATADVGLACSEPVAFRRYACPLKVMEYMAAGLPVVVTAGTEAAEIVTRARAGIAVAYDAAALARGLTELLGDGERRAALGRAGIEEARRLDWEHLVGRELELIGSHPAAARIAGAPRGVA